MSTAQIPEVLQSDPKLWPGKKVQHSPNEENHTFKSKSQPARSGLDSKIGFRVLDLGFRVLDLGFRV